MGRSDRNKSKTSRGGKNDKNKRNNRKTEPFDTSRLATILMAKGLVTSPPESTCLAESIVAEMDESELSREEACIASLEDYFSLSRKDAKSALSALLNLSSDDDDEDDSDDDTDDKSHDEENGGLLDEQYSEDEDNDGEFIGEGECELCERFIRLTHHHLIPRSTWPRILPRLHNASDALAKNDVQRAGLILGPGLLHLLEPLTMIAFDSSDDTGSNRAAIKGLVQRTCSICGPCHAAIHRTHPNNMTLATDFSTIELLLKDEKIFKFCRWASKQKPGKHSKV